MFGSRKICHCIEWASPPSWEHWLALPGPWCVDGMRSGHRGTLSSDHPTEDLKFEVWGCPAMRGQGPLDKGVD